MPIYDYRCNDCGTIYDIFHKVREVIEDIVCPSCHSANHTRLLSAPNLSLSERSTSASAETFSSSCDSGGCCGGACGVN